ncbi:hypothetical protein H6F93_05125 [Leptolyngbya sp. FACHB-671]|uniref:hypothetical protein n=1 Tax=Leptolyngbya sp. FACHB-671 TaxID=2692812 RepID=UPI00168435CF|nr:hypothetical protein [Leptolyngbya sp. FACHB-671]MBD2066918.1 hypothetical protein [Leptolyngbya sp. FACHB-671]
MRNALLCSALLTTCLRLRHNGLSTNGDRIESAGFWGFMLQPNLTFLTQMRALIL